MAERKLIDRNTLGLLLGTLAALWIPHLTRIPIWLSLMMLAIVAWRWMIHRKGLALPGALLRAVLVLGVFAVVLLDMAGPGQSVEVFVALLLSGFALKLLELRTLEDLSRLAVMLFLLPASQFLFSQEIALAGFTLLQVLLLLALLNSTVQEPDSRSFRTVTSMLVYALPVMLLLFVLVPRTGPLWGMPAPGGNGASTGISDEMSPGDISRLGQSTELAFRVGFEGATPAPESLYWRGLVLDSFDGRTWRRSERRPSRRQALERPRPSDSEAELLDYELIMEPHNETWLFALSPLHDFPTDSWQLPDYSLHSDRRVTQRSRFALQSEADAGRLPASGLSGPLEQALHLPDESNERARELAAQWRADTSSDQDYVERILRHFNEADFHYTLSPPALGRNAIDEFLFETRSGFCGHYAETLVFLLRSAGIPARVVVGYQGGEHNPFEDYVMVYQYNAHAWAEVWVEEQGWLRVDPTMAVAPERIEFGAEAWLAGQQIELGGDSGLLQRYRNLPLINALRLRLDSFDYLWSRWVINYDGQRQLQFLDRLAGVGDMGGIIRLFVLSSAALFSAFLLLLLLSGRIHWRRQDPARSLYRKFEVMARRHGCQAEPGEVPGEIVRRLGALRPDLEPAAGRLVAQFNRLYFGPPMTSTERKSALQSMQGELAWLRQRSGGRFSRRQSCNGNPVSQTRS